MEKNDYDLALFYVHRSDWDTLLILMVRTKDHFLSKKIEHFLHAYRFQQHDYELLQKKMYALLRYLDHAAEQNAEDLSRISG